MAHMCFKSHLSSLHENHAKHSCLPARTITLGMRKIKEWLLMLKILHGLNIPTNKTFRVMQAVARLALQSTCSLSVGTGFRFWGLHPKLGYCPHPVAVYILGPIKGYIEPYYNYYPTVTEGGAVPNSKP